MKLYALCKDCGHQWTVTGSLVTCPKCGGRSFYVSTAPQQEVKSAIEHGMLRYDGAMQKLSEGDK